MELSNTTLLKIMDKMYKNFELGLQSEFSQDFQGSKLINSFIFFN